MTHEVGNSTKLIRPPLPSEDCNKSLGFSRLCHRIHSIGRRREAGQQKQGKLRANKTSSAEPHLPRDMWQLRVDGASNQKGAGTGVVMITPDGSMLEQAVTLDFTASNNEAEHEALLASLRLQRS
ncbi:hypothetical protein L3X38_025133 [Prunus dulcis]|uniref:RNase H type-1 domain-containing protein n=1 Tax=Prunus dulcis TaxID=3755 RepID=A0AAD4W165_PRUDU|nr:hypothetical protein L3X38_025133 [Prunus dulcis]